MGAVAKQRPVFAKAARDAAGPLELGDFDTEEEATP
jgi:hypothetical protein